MRVTWGAGLIATAAAVALAVAAGGWALAAGGLTDVTFAGCLAGGKVTNVQVTRIPSCAASATPVRWAGQAAVTASPSPTPTTPSPSPTTPSPAPTGTAAWACVTSAAQGDCPFPGYPGVTGTTSDPYVDQNVWGAVPGETQTLSANSPGDWQVVSSTPAGHGGSVTTFPNTGAPFSEAPLSGYSSVIGSFAESMPHNAATSAWAAYDLWFSNWADEVMIQHDYSGQFPCMFAAVQQFGGSGGVPVQTWGLCVFGSEKVWQLTAPGTQAGGQNDYTVMESSGSVDIKAMVTWLASNGYLSNASPTVTNLSYGWEICSTGGQPETFTVTSYTLAAS